MKLALLTYVWIVLPWIPAVAEDYDPLRLPGDHEPVAKDFTVQDATREREIPLRVYLPPAAGSAQRPPAPVVLFSHGLGGSRDGYAYLGKHWAARGHVGVFLQHAGSDDSVWRNQTPAKRMAAMQQAASLQNYLLRVQDVTAVLDQLTAWNAEAGHALAGQLDLQRVGMSGHSFGAQTTQAVAGQSGPLGGQPFTDRRIKAAVVMSPGGPRTGSANAAFGSVKIPWLLMTGTHDASPIGGQTVESRLAVFPALPASEKYELVLHNAEHSVFSDRALPGDTLQRNPNHQRAIIALSTAFWDAFLRGEPAAKAWLDGPGPSRVMEPDDKWQMK